jgi:hypothetical protein
LSLIVCWWFVFVFVAVETFMLFAIGKQISVVFHGAMPCGTTEDLHPTYKNLKSIGKHLARQPAYTLLALAIREKHCYRQHLGDN